MASSNKKLKVDYVSHYIEDEECNNLPQYTAKSVVDSSVVRFRNCMYLLYRLSKVERILLDYITEEMDLNNHFANTSIFRYGFVLFMEGISTNEKFSEKSVQNAINNLKKTGLILSYTKGDYYVNPEYFFNGTKEHRTTPLRTGHRYSL